MGNCCEFVIVTFTPSVQNVTIIDYCHIYIHDVVVLFCHDVIIFDVLMYDRKTFHIVK